MFIFSLLAQYEVAPSTVSDQVCFLSAVAVAVAVCSFICRRFVTKHKPSAKYVNCHFIGFPSLCFYHFCFYHFCFNHFCSSSHVFDRKSVAAICAPPAE